MKWKESAIYINNLEIEIGFVICSSFYYGPENHFTEDQWHTLRESLELDDIPLYGENRSLTKYIINDEFRLIKYYYSVIKLCEKYKKCISKEKPYFWIHPLIYNTEGISIEIPYHDTYDDSQNFFVNFFAKEEGRIFLDSDMGWELSIYASNTDFYLREWNPDTGEDYNTIYFPKLLIQEQIPPLMQRTETIISVLTQALGEDYWSR